MQAEWGQCEGVVLNLPLYLRPALSRSRRHPSWSISTSSTMNSLHAMLGLCSIWRSLRGQIGSHLYRTPSHNTLAKTPENFIFASKVAPRKHTRKVHAGP